MSYSLAPEALLGPITPDVREAVCEAIIDLHHEQQKKAKHRDLQARVQSRMQSAGGRRGGRRGRRRGRRGR